MKQAFSKKLWIILISVCCVGTGIALACADGWGEEYGTSNFSPEIFVDSAYSPFFYSYQFYYKIGHEEDQDSRFNDVNTREWQAYVKNQLTSAEIYFLLNKASATGIDSAAKVRKNAGDKNTTAFLAYLQLAKKAEKFALNNVTNPWDYEGKAKDKKSFDADALNLDLQSAFSKQTDPFLKERYWFQLVRSCFFNTTPQQAIDYFNSNEKNITRNKMYYRCMAYAAGAYYKLKQFSKANYYYSRVYDSCAEMKTSAHYSFHPQEEKDWNATLALCRNNEEKITLWQMLGVFYSDEQRAINQIYKLNPASDKLDLLLARAINKYEQKFNQHDGIISDLQVDSTITASLPALIIKIATSTNTGKPWIWQMAAGYLKTLDEKFADAASWYAKAEKSIPNDKAIQAQLRLLKMINTIGGAKHIDSKLESQVLTDINWLKNFDAAAMPQLRYTDAFDWLKRKMAEKYRKQKDFVKAECFTSNSIFYADDKNVEALKSFLGKKDKSAYEKLCADMSAKKINDLFEFQAIRLTYSDSLDAAIEKMSKAGGGSDGILPGNPFNGRIQDCHDCDHEAAQKIKYSKLSFLKKILEIKNKIVAGEDVFTNAILLANAHYNITHFGNARFFYESKVLGESHSDPYYIDSAYRKMLTGMDLATKYYSLALKNAVTDEQKAKCQYMLAKCQRNQWYNDKIYNKTGTDAYTEEGMVDFKALAGFKALKQYSNTQYYKDVVRECGYFRTYTGKAK